jgi:hypothetical protein
MTDLHEAVGDGGTLVPPPPSAAPETPPDSHKRLTPARLAVLFVVVLAAVLGGTVVANTLLHKGSSDDQAMNDWLASSGQHYLDVSHDIAPVSTAQDYTALRAACVKLGADVGQARSDPPMPLGSLQSQWSVILTDLATTSDDCVKAVDQQDSNLLKAANASLQDAAQAYLGLAKTVQQFGG